MSDHDTPAGRRFGAPARMEGERGAIRPARPQVKRKASYCAACCSAPCCCAEVAEAGRTAIERDAESLSRPI